MSFMGLIKVITAPWEQSRLNKWTGNIQVNLSLDFPCLFHLLLCCVIELLDLAGPSLGMHWGGWAVSPNPCRREAYTRGGNKVSRQRICATAWSYSSSLCAASSSTCTATNHHCVNPLATSTWLWVHVASNLICVLLPTARTSSQHVFNCLWNIPQTKI